jgi:riboflavin synthase
MFTGIITDRGRIERVEPRGERLRRIAIRSGYDAAGIAVGASIACSGVCLTVVGPPEPAPGGSIFEVDAAAETLAVTAVGAWRAGDAVNLERALKIGDELGGHIVTGHVDGLARILAVEAVTAAESGWGATRRFVLEAPDALQWFIAAKGSVALDGASLTVNTVEGRQFSVLLIPHTLDVTTWGDRRAGDLVHLEIDMMARYAARLAERRE